MASSNSNNSSIRNKIAKILPEKQFAVRNSLLTDLFNNRNIKNVYNIFLASFFGLFLNSAIGNYVQKGQIEFGVTIIRYGFHNVHIALIAWTGFFAVTCLWYVIFFFWIKIRHRLSPLVRTPWDSFSALFLLAYFTLALLLALFIVFIFRLPPASAAIVIIEEARFMVKIYSFIRSNLFKATRSENGQENQSKLADFSTYLYFLFAPTLIYQDTYPRNKEIRWIVVGKHTAEVISLVFYYSFIVERYFIPAYQELGMRKFSWGEILQTIFENAIAGALILLTAFYMILHCWLNLFAELLRFGDRLFYEDWWNASTASDFIRKWNLVVNNWYYMYIYKDLYEIIGPMNKKTARFIVFVLSALSHEMFLWLILQFCLPVLLIEYIIFGLVISCCVACSRWSIPKFLYWYGLAFGTGHIVSLYAMELCLRINNPAENRTIIDLLIPRLLNTTNYVQ